MARGPASRSPLDRTVNPPAPIEISLAGRVEIRTPAAQAGPTRFPGRQGRLAFAYLVLAGRAVDRDELAELLWPADLPGSWARDLSAVISKLRSLLREVTERELLSSDRRSYALRLPDGARVDVVEAEHELATAQDALDAGRLDCAVESAGVAADVLGQPFLPGDESVWIDRRRAHQRELLLAALAVRAEALTEQCQPGAVVAASAVVDLEPDREPGYVLLMRAHGAVGNRVEVLRVHERLRVMLADGFGLSPGDEAGELARAALGEEPPSSPRPATTELPAVLAAANLAPLVGRAPLHAAKQRSAAIAMLTGEPGIGKTRLAAHWAAEAHARGVLVLYAAGLPGPREPHAAWIGALQPLTNAAGGSAALAQVARRLVGHLTAAPIHHDNDDTTGEFTRAELLRVATHELATLAADHAVLLVLDDVHDVDEASVRFVDHAVRTVARFNVIATAREPELASSRAAPMIQRLRSDRLLASIRLDGFDRASLAVLLTGSATNTTALTPELVDEIYAATAGNPLYALELARHRSVTARGVPPSLAELIDANVARLGSRSRRILEAAAVAGSIFDVEILVRVVALPADDVLDALEVATRAGIVAEHPDRPDHFRFVQPLVHEVILHAQSRARRARLHARAAEAIESLHGSHLDAHVAHLAHHLHAATQIEPAADALDYARRAADRAMAVGAYDEAAQWYERALSLAGDGAEPRTTIRLQVAVGDAYNKAGDAKAAASPLLEAVVLARAQRDPEEFGRAVVALGALLRDEGFESGAVDRELVSLIDEARASMPEPSALRARLEARLAMELHFDGDRDRCTELAALAEADAVASDDADAIAVALAARHYSLYGSPNVHDRLAIVAEIQSLGTRRPDPRWTRNYLELGDIAAADAADSRFERRRATGGIASDRYYAAVWRATRALLVGELPLAEAASADAARIGRESARGHAGVGGVEAAQIFCLRMFDGRLAELAPMVDALADSNPQRPVWRAAAAFVALEIGDRRRAEAQYRALRSAGFDRLPDTVDLPATLALLSWVAADIAGLADTRLLLRRLRPYAGLFLCVGASAAALCLGPASYPLAVLEARLGRLERAALWFEQARHEAERAGARPWMARLLFDRARLLVDRSTTARAQDLADAHALATECGMPALRDRCAGLLAAG